MIAMHNDATRQVGDGNRGFRQSRSTRGWNQGRNGANA